MIRRRDIDVPRPRNRSCRAIVLNIVRDRSVDLTRKRVRSLCGVQHMVALGPRSLCGVQTGGSVDGVCIIQECVCRRYGGERRTIVMHMFRADAVPHTTTLFSPSLFLFRPPIHPFLSYHLVPIHSADFLAVGQHRHHRKICCALRRESLFPSVSTSSRKKFVKFIASQEGGGL